MKRAATAALLFLLLTAPARPDEKSARFFTERGNQALKEKKHEEARGFFQKALAELEGHLPALLGMARAANAQGQKDEAVASLAECVRRAALKKLTEEEKGVLDAARKLFKKLDPAQLEFTDLAAELVGKLLALAEKAKDGNPDLARRCVDRILFVMPNHARARALRSDLPPPRGQPVEKLEEILVFDGKGLVGWTGKLGCWSVADGVLVGAIPTEGPSLVHTETPFEGDFSLVVEMRVLEDRGLDPMVAILWGIRGMYESYALRLFGSGFSFCRSADQEREEVFERIGYYKVASFDPRSWSVYRVDLEGGRISTTVNGRPLAVKQVPAGSLGGAVGIWLQDRKVEIRRFVVLR
ncbi:MAG: family 16 glycoside hydrolase [Planctomycetota bacterium]|jgi:tetratricopeptide (TPR) repeat protein